MYYFKSYDKNIGTRLGESITKKRNTFRRSEEIE